MPADSVDSKETKELKDSKLPKVETKANTETKAKAERKNSKSKMSTAIIVEAEAENNITVTVAKKIEEKKEEKKKDGAKEAKEWYWDYDNECWKECDPDEEYEWEYIEDDENAKVEEAKTTVAQQNKVTLQLLLLIYVTCCFSRKAFSSCFSSV